MVSPLLVVTLLSIAATSSGNFTDCTSIAVIPYYFDQNTFSACSNAGQCVNSTCVCNTGYTGRSDLLNFEGKDCQINELAITILWAFNVAWSFFFYIRSLPRIRLRVNQYLATRKLRIDQGLKYPIYKNRGVIATLVGATLGIPSVIAFGILKLVVPELRIGLDFAPTLLHALARTGFYVAVYFFQPSLFSTLLQSKKYKAKARNLILINEWGTLFVCSVSVLLGFTPFATLYASDNGTGDVAIAVWFVLQMGTVLMLVCLCVQAVYLYRKVKKVLAASYSAVQSKRVLKIKNALLGMQLSAGIQALCQGIVYSALCFWTFMYGKYDYYLPIGWLAYAYMIKKIAFTAVAADDTTSKVSQNSTEDSKNSKEKTAANQSSFVTSYQQPEMHAISFQSKAASFHEEFFENPQYTGETDDGSV